MSTWMSVFLRANLLVVLLSGCGWVPSTKLANYQKANRRLSEQSRAQLIEIENLKVHAHGMEDALIQAETQLASLHQKYEESRNQLVLLSSERAQLPEDLLSLRGNSPEAVFGVSGRLTRLAEKHPDLHYDEETGISKLMTNVLFDSGEDVLKPGAQQLLDDLVNILSSDNAQGLKVMVAGHTDNQRIRGSETRHRFRNNWHLSTARALAVAKYMQAGGIEGDRLGLAGFGKFQPIVTNNTPQSRQKNRRVEIFVMRPDLPVVGMTETLTNFY